MEHKILVGYASGSGSTREVAECIAEELESTGVVVDVLEAARVRQLDAYSAVVLGSSIRFGTWLPDALAFLDRFSGALSERPVAFFMTCLTILKDTENAWETALAYWHSILQHVPGVDPAGLGLFAGSLAPELGRLQEYQSSTYGDHRDWEVIRTWAQDIRHALLAGSPRATVPMVLSGTVLSFTDMSGQDLSRFDFQDAELVQARLRDARLQEADLRQARLEASDLRGADLSNAQLSGADLNRVQAQAADFSKANLMGANLDQADLEGAELPFAILNGARLRRAMLRKTNFQYADLNWADLQGADLGGANLAQANLGWANLLEAQLGEAALAGARYNSQTRWPADFSPQEAGCILVENVPL